jgi:cytochrome c oxidase subunit 2
MVAQTQAMPGYVNKLQVRFTKPGDYEVLCLEYCGVAHHGMRAVIKVVAGSK